jgi:hypothetical protein
VKTRRKKKKRKIDERVKHALWQETRQSLRMMCAAEQKS